MPGNADLVRRLKPIFYRAGWSGRGNKRVGWLWVWVGPYVIGWGWD